MFGESVNFRSLSEGLAYPTYYTGLFHDLRTELTTAVAAARAAGLNIWAEDKTNTGFSVTGLPSITEGGGSIAGFLQFLTNGEEGITVLSTSHFTHFDTVVTVVGATVTMTEPPENIVFDE